MDVLVAGATGALGRPFVRQMIARGHRVVAVVRSDAAERTARELGAEPTRASLFDADALARAGRGCDAVVRLATHIAKGRATAADWRANDRIRREGTRALLEATRAIGASIFAQESIVWTARPPDGAPFDEGAPPRPDAKTASAVDAERMAAEAAARDGFAAATLRLGWLYGPDTAHTRSFARLLRWRALPLVGGGTAPLSFLHVDDAASAFVHALERRTPGLWHVVDAEPAPLARFLGGLADAVGAPAPLRVPRAVGTVALGPWLTRFLTTPMVTSAAPFRRAAGWTPAYPTLREGLAQTAATWARGG